MSQVEAHEEGRQSIHLAKMHPVRQLENNWSIDIAGWLADYIHELASTELEPDGLRVLDFAEAALVVQNSSSTYGKKVEHLYKLTMGVIENSRKKVKSRTSRRRQEEELDDECILTLQDSLEKFQPGNAYIQDPSQFTSIEEPRATPAMLQAALRSEHYPTVAFIHESRRAQTNAQSAVDGPSDAPTYNMMRCQATLSPGMYMILHENSESKEAEFGEIPRKVDDPNSGVFKPVPGLDQGTTTMDGFGSPVLEENNDPRPVDDWCGDGGGEDNMDWDEPAMCQPVEDVNGNKPDEGLDAAAQDQPVDQAESKKAEHEDLHNESLGVWEPLDPHEETDDVKKLKVHKPKLRSLPKSVRLETFQPFNIPPPENAAHQRFRMMLLDIIQCNPKKRKSLQKPVRKKTEIKPGPALSEEDPVDDHDGQDAVENLPEAGDAQELPENHTSDGDWGFDGGGEHDYWGPDFADGTLSPNAELRDQLFDHFEVKQPAAPGTLAYEDLVERFSEAQAAASAAVLSQNTLTQMVVSWRERINAVMKDQEKRPAFDIRRVGNDLVERAGVLCKEKTDSLKFNDIIRCSQRYEVARNFSAFLQQVNEGKVEVIRGDMPSDPFYLERVRLLQSTSRWNLSYIFKHKHTSSIFLEPMKL